jgi:ADP-ribosyl-[dinitrogen reductase] hydrolase
MNAPVSPSEPGQPEAISRDSIARARGCAAGAAIGDALGMPLEFKPANAPDRLVHQMENGRLPAGTFTDDTEMALALAEGLLHARPLDPADLALRFSAWLQAGPSDVGIQTQMALAPLANGVPWQETSARMLRQCANAAGNGSLMRCWPAALAHWNSLPDLLADTRLQSQVTHPQPDCVEACALVNAMIFFLLRGTPKEEALALALAHVQLSPQMAAAVADAPGKRRDQLPNTGWVVHTLESAVWGLLTTTSFAEAVIQVVNLGSDADTAGAVVGALAGAAYGYTAIPIEWSCRLRGYWPIQTNAKWQVEDFIRLANQLVKIPGSTAQGTAQSTAQGTAQGA